MSSLPIRILMTGAGAPGAPGIIHCLKQDKNISLVVGDADPDATGRFLNEEFIRLPPAAHENFADEILQLCIENNIRLVLPLVTRELFHFAKRKNDFLTHGIDVLVSSENAINISNNKSACYSYLKENGIDIPRFAVVTDLDGFRKAAVAMGFPQKPFCFKPSVSNGSRGVRIVSENLNESDLLFNHKPYQLFISYEQAIHVLSSAAFPELLISEYLPGLEYSVDCLAKNGEVVLAVPRSRKKMINGISVQGEFVNDKQIIEYCTGIIASIGLHGNIGIQVKQNAEDKPLLLEINPRVQGTIVAALGAGVNLPLLAVRQEMGMVADAKELNVKWGTKFSRFWSEVFY